MDEHYEAADRLKRELSTAVHDPGNPTWAYRMKNGAVEGKVFAAKDVPDGWYDSPANIPEEVTEDQEPSADAPEEPVVEEPEEPEEPEETPNMEHTAPKKMGRPRKVRDGDSA